MKKLYITTLIFLLFCLASCGKSEKKETITALTSEKWINAYTGEAYSFNEDGTGTHGNLSITYTISENELLIMEGASATKADSYTLDFSSEIKRITPENAKTYYVTESDYETVGKAIREESIQTLTSVEWWTRVLGTNYIQFDKIGVGWYLETSGTRQFSWEMASNTSVTITLDGEGTMTLNIVNDDGDLKLVNANTHTTVYVPKK